MSLKVPAPGATWSPAYQARVNQAAEAADIGNRKVGQNVVITTEKLTLKSSPGGKTYQVVVADDGTLSTALIS